MLGPLVNSTTGDYVEENGDIQNNILQMTQAYQRLQTPRRKWLYAPNKDYGSDLFRLEANYPGKATPLLGEKIIFNALTPMVQNGEIKNLTVEYVGISDSGQWIYKVGAQTAQGNPLLFFYPPNEVINAF